MPEEEGRRSPPSPKEGVFQDQGAEKMGRPADAMEEDGGAFPGGEGWDLDFLGSRYRGWDANWTHRVDEVSYSSLLGQGKVSESKRETEIRAANRSRSPVARKIPKDSWVNANWSRPVRRGQRETTGNVRDFQKGIGEQAEAAREDMEEKASSSGANLVPDTIRSPSAGDDGLPVAAVQTSFLDD